MGFFGLNRKKSKKDKELLVLSGDNKNDGDGNSSTLEETTTNRKNVSRESPHPTLAAGESSSAAIETTAVDKNFLHDQLRLSSSNVTSSSNNSRGSGSTSTIGSTLLFKNKVLTAEPSMQMLPQLLKDLDSSRKTSSDRPARALRQLFALSEHGSSTNNNRTEMVRVTTSPSDTANQTHRRNGSDGRQLQLVPTLLNFLTRCKKGSSEQYLALLVLNNISIPSANKRIIALDNGGAKILSRLLCEDPSCHLMAIILVNLTFADEELRRELVSIQLGVEIVEALSFALRVASLTTEEYAARRSIIEDPDAYREHREDDGNNEDNGDQDIFRNSPKQRLANLVAADRRLRSVRRSDLDYSSSSRGTSPRSTHQQQYPSPPLLSDASKQLFPETARWCLTALKNLTRPSEDATVATALVSSGIVPLILEYICISATTRIGEYGGNRKSVQAGGATKSSQSIRGENSSSQSSSEGSPSPVDPLQHCVEFTNAPCTWDSNSMQDAALFVITNLAANPSSRQYVKEADGVSVLTFITKYRTLHLGSASPSADIEDGLTKDERSQEAFQCIKAKMGLAFLVGSEGHFGQPKLSSTASKLYSNPDDSVLLLSEGEIRGLVELLANTMHDRSKDGAGGYSAATFGVKYVLFAWRCLLTHPSNQIRVAKVAGVHLNSLLLKALARHAISRSNSMDVEAAEYAAFALYLQSSYSFKDAFLPAMYASPDERNCLSAKVFAAYLRLSTITSAGRHAAEQVLLRLPYLIFKGRMSELAKDDGTTPSVSDMSFEDDLLARSETIFVERRTVGAEPRPDIFDRPILRSRAPRRGNKQRAPWDNRASISVFPSALHAVQQLSYGSTKVRHVDYIDDIMIANNIANSANGEKTESYNYWWSWQDTAGEIQRNLERQRSQETASIFSGYSIPLGAKSSELAEPFSIFGFRCLGLCSQVDSTTQSP